MRIANLAAACLAAVLLTPVPAASEIVPLEWDDLLPAGFYDVEKEADALQASLDALPEDAQDAFRLIGVQRLLRRRVEEGVLKPEDLTPDNRELVERDYEGEFPKAAAIADAVDVLNAKVKELDSAPNADLDGKIVRMPGYVLPLEFDGTETVEFLLVPFVGACIHVPPPPPNQMVHVIYKPGYVSQGLYAPVYVTGRLSAVGASVDLYLTDGQSAIETGYRLEAATIEAAKD